MSSRAVSRLLYVGSEAIGARVRALVSPFGIAMEEIAPSRLFLALSGLTPPEDSFIAVMLAGSMDQLTAQMERLVPVPVSAHLRWLLVATDSSLADRRGAESNANSWAAFQALETLTAPLLPRALLLRGFDELLVAGFVAPPFRRAVSDRPVSKSVLDDDPLPSRPSLPPASFRQPVSSLPPSSMDEPRRSERKVSGPPKSMREEELRRGDSGGTETSKGEESQENLRQNDAQISVAPPNSSPPRSVTFHPASAPRPNVGEIGAHESSSVLPPASMRPRLSESFGNAVPDESAAEQPRPFAPLHDSLRQGAPVLLRGDEAPVLLRGDEAPARSLPEQKLPASPGHAYLDAPSSRPFSRDSLHAALDPSSSQAPPAESAHDSWPPGDDAPPFLMGLGTDVPLGLELRLLLEVAELRVREIHAASPSLDPLPPSITTPQMPVGDAVMSLLEGEGTFGGARAVTGEVPSSSNGTPIAARKARRPDTGVGTGVEQDALKGPDSPPVRNEGSASSSALSASSGDVGFAGGTASGEPHRDGAAGVSPKNPAAAARLENESAGKVQYTQALSDGGFASRTDADSLGRRRPRSLPTLDGSEAFLIGYGTSTPDAETPPPTGVLAGDGLSGGTRELGGTLELRSTAEMPAALPDPPRPRHATTPLPAFEGQGPKPQDPRFQAPRAPDLDQLLRASPDGVRPLAMPPVELDGPGTPRERPLVVPRDTKPMARIDGALPDVRTLDRSPSPANETANVGRPVSSDSAGEVGRIQKGASYTESGEPPWRVPPQPVAPLGVLRALGGAIAKRADAIFAVHSPEGDRQLKLDGGDISTVSSTCPEDALPLFLARQGRVRSDVAHRIAARPAKHPRHVAAALVAEGWLTQDELWTVLAAHASSILAAMLGLESGTMEGGPLHVPGRPTGGTYDAKSLALDDDSPFGGRPGATVFVDAARRSIDPTRAVFAAGGPDARIGAVLLPALLRECGLTEREERELLVPDRTLAQLSGPDERDALACVLAALGIFQFVVPLVPAQKVAPSSDEQLLADGRALEERLALRLSMVEEGDYFSVLGVSRNANGYEVRGAYLRLKNEFSTQRLETLGLAARRKDVEKVLFVLEEAYEVLRDESKRDRYRRAIS